MPRSRSLVASPDPASFLFLSSSRICRLMPHRASEPFSCAISGTIEPVCLPTVPSRAPSNLSVYQLCHLVHHRICLSTNHATSGIIESFLFFTSSFRSRPRRSDQTRLCRSCYITTDYTRLFRSHSSCSSPPTSLMSHQSSQRHPRPFRSHADRYHEQCSMPYHVFPSHRPIPIAFARICCHLRPSLVYHQTPSPSHDPIAYSSIITTPLPACVTLHHHRSSSSPTDYRRSRPIAFAYAIKFSLCLSGSPTQSHYSKYGGRTSSNGDPNNKHDN